MLPNSGVDALSVAARSSMPSVFTMYSLDSLERSIVDVHFVSDCSSLYEYLDRRQGAPGRRWGWRSVRRRRPGTARPDLRSGARESDIVTQQVQGVHRQPTTVTAVVARPDHKAVADRDRIVAADDLTEVAGCGELVVHATVDHEVRAPRDTLRSTTRVTYTPHSPTM